MTEIAEKVGSGKVSTLKINSERRIYLGNEPKHRVRASIIGRGSRIREVSLVQKEIRHPGGADEFIKEWQRLKSAGIPTIPTVRKISPSEVVMTDMTLDGGAFFGKSDLWESKVRKERGKAREIDRRFVEIDLKEIEAQGNEIAQQATDHDIALPYDDPFDLLVHPDGTWQLVVLDIDNQSAEGELAEHNSKAVIGMLGYLKKIKRTLEN